MTRARIEALQRTAMFGAIDEATVAFLLERAGEVDVPAGDYFFREGERGNSAFLLESGELSVFKAWDEEQHLLRHLKPGDCFGEVALLDLGPRSASVRADSDAHAIEIQARDLLGVRALDVEQFALIYMNLGRELSRRLRAADERLFRARFDPAVLSAAHSAALATARAAGQGDDEEA